MVYFDVCAPVQAIVRVQDDKFAQISLQSIIRNSELDACCPTERLTRAARSWSPVPGAGLCCPALKMTMMPSLSMQT